MTDKLNDKSGVVVKGHIKIHDPKTGEVYVDKRNAIHYENMSIALAAVSYTHLTLPTKRIV